MPNDSRADATKVYLLPHDPAWAARAAEESRRISEAIGPSILAIHHIGSTSIPGIVAKPTIDLMPVVTSASDLDPCEEPMKRLGYIWRGEFGIEGRRYCPFEQDGRRIFHVHIYSEENPQVARQLAFRDYLRAHRDEALAYEAAKRAAAAAYPDNSLAYNEHKGVWMKGAIERAEAWAAR
jgi:GrpB-like predicted nucleotidyltransferase (UPF0157 family)